MRLQSRAHSTDPNPLPYLMVVDPPGTLLKVSLLCLLAGMGWAILGAMIVYVGSTRIEPRVHPSRIWADWQLHRMLWALAVVGPALGTFFSADAICKNIGMKDLYWWVSRPGDLYLICRLGAATGLLLTFFLLTYFSLRRAQRKPAAARRPPRC